jgi:hypothetical protein
MSDDNGWQPIETAPRDGVPYYYVTTAADGSAQLVTNQSVGFLVLP